MKLTGQSCPVMAINAAVGASLSELAIDGVSKGVGFAAGAGVALWQPIHIPVASEFALGGDLIPNITGLAADQAPPANYYGRRILVDDKGRPYVLVDGERVYLR